MLSYAHPSNPTESPILLIPEFCEVLYLVSLAVGGSKVADYNIILLKGVSAYLTGRIFLVTRNMLGFWPDLLSRFLVNPRGECTVQ